MCILIFFQCVYELYIANVRIRKKQPKLSKKWAQDIRGTSW